MAAGDLDLSSCVVSWNSARSHAATSWGSLDRLRRRCVPGRGLRPADQQHRRLEHRRGGRGFERLSQPGAWRWPVSAGRCHRALQLRPGGQPGERRDPREAGVLSAYNSIVYGNSGTQIVESRIPLLRRPRWLARGRELRPVAGVRQLARRLPPARDVAVYRRRRPRRRRPAGHRHGRATPRPQRVGRPRALRVSTALFADGFESSDTSEWSWTTP